MNQAVKQFKNSMQKLSNESGTTISMSFNGEEKVISKPFNVEEAGAIITPEPSLPPLHLACSADELRPNLQLIKIKNNIATATNGHMIVKLDLSLVTMFDVSVLEMLNGKNIHKEVFKEIHKCDSVQFFEDQIDCWNNGIKKTFYYSNADGELWDDNVIINEIKEAGEEPKRLMAYNPDYLNILQKIFKTKQLIFSFTAGKKGTLVFPEDGSGMFSVLMPIDVGAVNRYFFT